MAGDGPDARMLLWGAAALAMVAGVFHFYFAFAYFGDGSPLRITFIGIGAIFIAGAVAGLLNVKRELVVKAGAGWTVLTILTWGLGAAYGSAAGLQPLSFVDKAVEALLLVLLILLMRAKTSAVPVAA